ncbi:adenosine deaminase [Uliginosibacterium paludis]|uniref:adenosine deaminase n=1 Tax=Uliginosibacterium paludis TaxID=1615952 RepID=A0ABV2CPP8_9RHOO
MNTLTDWQGLPKVLLHEHLDGGLRPQTLLELCTAQGIPLPAPDAPALAAWMQANADSGSLVRYLQGFALTVNAIATLDACERVAFEAAEDARLDGCVLAEFRMAPLLLEPFGLAPEAVIEAVCAGLARSSLESGLIVCAMRTDSAESSLRAARIAGGYQGQGVVGFDLAGAEFGYPPGLHASALKLAGEAGLGLTCHAGEADAGIRVLEAAALGATRIGHGVNIMKAPSPTEGEAWLEEARRLGLHFEVCPSSNVHTGAAPSLAAHPILAMLRAGLSVSCSTDNRLMSGVTLSDEFRRLHEHLGLEADEASQLMLNAAKASFLPADSRERAGRAIASWRNALPGNYVNSL